jgi:hypothetical protein
MKRTPKRLLGKALTAMCTTPQIPP